MKKIPERDISMKSLYLQGWTLQEIGDKYNISRERVRQILEKFNLNGNEIRRQRADAFKDTLKGLTYDKFINKVRELKVNASKAYELSRKNIRNPISKKDSAVYRGFQAEEYISNILREKGFENELMPNHASFDILVNGKIRIDVKSGSKSRVTSKKQVSPIYGFNIRKNKKKDYCDFFILYINDTKDVFVVPNSEVGYIETVYISYPTVYNTPQRLRFYKDRFDLLKG